MNKKIRIICAVTNDLTHDRRMDRICRSLISAGYDVTLIGRKRSTSRPLQPKPYQQYRMWCFFDKGVLFYAAYNKALFLQLLFRRCDILCACDLDTALPVILVSTWRGKKSVYDAHEYFTEVPELTGRPFVRKIWERIARFAIPKFDLAYTVGEEIADIMSRRYHRPFDLVRNIGYAKSYPASEKPVVERDKILFYQGALNVGRGLEVLIRSMAQLPEWKLWLAGEGDITSELKRISEYEKVSDRVVFLGWIAPDKLPDLMSRVQIGVNLRDAASLNDYYSLANKFFDFIHAGLPSIHMEYPEYKKLIDRYHCAMYLHELTSDAIVQLIKSIELEPDRLARMTAACAIASRELCWEKEEINLLRLYRNLIPASPIL